MAGKKFWNMQVRAAASQVGEIYLYSTIASSTWWGDEITPLSFKADLDALGTIDELHLYVNSPGGDVFAGIAIYNMIKRHPAGLKVAHVDGIAASIASVICMAANTVIMPENSMQMVHNPWMFLFGGYNADELTKMADDLTKMREPLITSYQSKTGLNRDELVAVMDGETWLTAAECLAQGFCDEVAAAMPAAAALRGDTLVVNGQEFDLSRFRNRPNIAALAAGQRPAAHRSPDPAPPAPGPVVLDAGRVLSSENEAHIRSAHEALGKVLDKLGADDADAAADAAADEAGGPPPADPPPGPAADEIVPPAPGPPDAGADVDAKARNAAYLETLRAQIATRRRR